MTEFEFICRVAKFYGFVIHESTYSKCVITDGNDLGSYDTNFYWKYEDGFEEFFSQVKEFFEIRD
jgi:hypothetical protein